MDYHPLGRSGIEVSAICLGSMTWGVQNTQDEGFEQMDYALDQGVNFIDTAEMYPIAQSAETYGRTEEIIGNWMAERNNRDRMIIATKVIGPGSFSYIRGGKTRHNREHILAAAETSLKRLRTDYIDLYQLHWPDRATNTFGKLAFEPQPEEDMTPLEESLAALDDLVKAGKVRTVGVSNENPWGVMKFIALAEAGLGPRMASIQNPYSLLNRSFETRMAEVSIRENVGLLAYAPQAAGALSGKYLDGKRPEGARMTLWPHNKRYASEHAQKAIQAYMGIAKEHGLDPCQMAVAYCLGKAFMTSAIIGATTMAQLKNGVAAADVVLSSEVLEAIEEAHKIYTYPCP
ncbi:MAG: aldo/keto reductase [Pseudomonadota bacterium]